MESVIRKFLNPTLVGRGWDSTIAALAAGDQITRDNAVAAFDQVFLVSASGLYLQRRASDQGVQDPPGVNMSDDLFRQLAIVQKTKKLTQEAILEVLEVFYGVDAVRGSLTSTADETYVLVDGDTLDILLDEKVTVHVDFVASHFARIGMAMAVEVAAEISRAFAQVNSAAYATTVLNPETGAEQVRIYSSARGLSSSVRIVGGSAQTKLLFPTSIYTTSGSSPFAVWNVALSPTNPGNLRFTETSGIYDLFQLRTNDLVYIYGPEFAACNCNGTFTVEEVSVSYSGVTKIQWFEIANPNGIAASSISQTLFTDLMFFRPLRGTLYNNPRHVVVCENGDHLDVIIPATTQIVNRKPGTAAYLNVNPAISISSLTRFPNGIVNVATATPHELSQGDQIIIDGASPHGTLPSPTAGTPSVDWASSNDTKTGTSDYAGVSVSSQTGTYQSTYSKALALLDGISVMVIGGQTTGATINPNLTIFQETGETYQSSVGGYQTSYLWTQIADDGAHGFSGYHMGQRYFASCVLTGGDVLAAGGGTGDDVSGTPTTGWDRFTFYSPTTIFQQSGGMSVATMSGALAGTQDGNGLFTGGWHVAGTALATAYVFNASSNTWTAKASMATARFHHSLTTLPNGHVLAAGGTDGTNPIRFCEVYNVGGNTWSATGALTTGRYSHAIVNLPDGRVLAIGGLGAGATALASCEVYDPVAGYWLPIPPMRTARDNPVAGYSPTRNCVIVSGGTGVSTIEILDLATMKWRTAPVQLAAAHANSTGVVISSSVQDILLVAGGDISGTTEKKNFIFAEGGDGVNSGLGLNRVTTVASVVDGTHFTYDTSDVLNHANYWTQSTTGTVTAMKANSAPATVPGPFSYDLDAGLAITDVNAVLNQDIVKGSGVASIALATSPDPTPALLFPDQVGYLVFNFGFENQVGPVRYFGRLTETELILDASTPFPVAVPSGSPVRLLFQRTPWQPDADALVGNFYLTGTAAGRVAAQKTVDAISPAGKNILISVIYPSDEGLGAEGFPQANAQKLSDKVAVWGGDDLDQEIPLARLGEDT